MDQFGSDELVATLEVLIESYADQMGPYAQVNCTFRMYENALHVYFPFFFSVSRSEFVSIECLFTRVSSVHVCTRVHSHARA
jgi:hypothetical protein